MTAPGHVLDAGSASEIAAALRDGRDPHRPTSLLVVALLGLDVVRGIDGRPAAAAAGAEIRSRLAGLGAEGVTVLPLDSDDIALVCPGTDEDAGQRLAERVVDLVGEPIAGPRPVRLMANVGVAVATSVDERAQDVVRDADTALAAAMARGPGSVEAFGPGLRRRLESRMQTAVELAGALATGEGLFLHYQPVFDLAADRIVGVEALIRWRHPERGLVSPVEFIPVAEQTGLITELGCWVLDAAAAQLVEWEPLLGPEFRLHVNLSPVEVRAPRLGDKVHEALDRHDVSPTRLLLEITETGLMTDDGAPLAQFEELRRTGVALGIDDFGTGYSSISRLRDLPVDLVKLDRSLTALVASSPDEYALTRAIFGLLRSSGLDIVAEGIEEHVQVAHLRAMRCRLGQGFLLARPTLPEQVTELLRNRG